jgi:hypothetical protein
METGMRVFEGGATRHKSDHKYDYEGFISPLVVREYGRYMHSHRQQADGSLRDSDNWTNGMPKREYVKSLFRHFHDVWMITRGFVAKDFDGKRVCIKDALCAIIFNASGYLHEILKVEAEKEAKPKKVVYCAGPYTAPTREGVAMHVKIAEEYGKRVLEAGFVPIVPHRLSVWWDLDARFKDFEHDDWLNKFCYPLLQAADILFLYPGFTHSEGAKLEMDYALRHHIPIVYSVDELMQQYGGCA